MSDDKGKTFEPTPPAAPEAAEFTILLRFPVANNMAMQAQVGGRVNDQQLAWAVLWLQTLAQLRIGAGIQRELAAVNEQALARARLVVPNGMPSANLPGLRRG